MEEVAGQAPVLNCAVTVVFVVVAEREDALVGALHLAPEFARSASP
jgi:hypothetical protein